MRPAALLPALITTVCLGLPACKKSEEPTGGGGGKPPAKKVDTHESLAGEAIGLTTKLTDIFAGVKDEATATAAAAKLDELYAQFEAINKRMEAMGAPTGELKDKVEGMFEAQHEEIGNKMESAMGIFLGNRDVGQIILPALEKFGKNMEGLKALELWEGESGPE